MARRQFWCFTFAFFMAPLGLCADTLRGVVHDERGQPVAGARIDVATAAPKVGRGIFCPSCYLDCKKWTRSNEQGEFVIEGLDPKLKFRILSTATGKQTKMTDLINPSNETANLILLDFPFDTPATQILEGTIVSSEGIAIPGALVEPYGAKTPQKRWWGQVEAQPTVSDEKGRFRMLITGANYEGVDVVVLADGYAGAKSLLLKPGHDLHEIKVPSGTSVTGQLRYKGQPQAGQRIAVVQTQRGVENHFIKSVLAITNSDGRFEFNNLPANQQYAIFSPVGEADPSDIQPVARILTTKKFNCRADNERRDLGAFELSDSCSVSGKLEMTDGTNLPDGLKMNLSRDPAWDLIEVPIDQAGNFKMDGLPPETYEFMVNSKGIRIDGSRLSYQIVRLNSFGMRLSESCEGILIPLLQDGSILQKLDSNKKQEAASDPNQESSDTLPEIAPGHSESPGGTRIAVELSDEPAPPDGPKLGVSGTVITAKGERIAGATLILRAKIGGQFYAQGTLNNRDLLARSKSNADGRFLFSRVPIPLRLTDTITSLISDQGGAQLLCFADGFAMTAVDLPSLDNKEKLRVVLGPEADVRGVVQDESGKGIPGATIELIGTTTTSGPINHVLSGPTDLNLIMSQVERFTTTDDDGVFVIKNMPKNRRVIVAAKADHYVRQVMAIETTIPLNGIPKRTDELMFKDRISVQQSPVEFKLESSPVVTVRVVDHEGQPVEDGSVEFNLSDGKKLISHETKAVSAKIGTVTFAKPASGQAKLRYFAEPLKPRVGISVTVDDLEADRDQPFELRLPESRWITGQVLNSATGEPVVGARIHAGVAASQKGGAVMSSDAISGENGEFRIPVAFGENRFIHWHETFGFIQDRADNGARKPPVVVHVEKEGELPEVTLKLCPGLIVEGTVVDQLGKPVVNAVVRAGQTQAPYRSVAARTNNDGKYRIAGLAPSSETLLTVSNGAAADRVTINGVIVKEDLQVRHETVDLTVQTGVQLTGRVMRNGKPQPGVRMELARSLPGKKNTNGYFTTVTTDDDGRYLAGGLEPGDSYGFKIITKDNSTAPGWTHQSPYIQTIPENATGVIELPDANLVGSNQALGGIVVDPDGKPVGGITVSASLKMGRSLARRDNLPPPWTETDETGCFQLTQLPDDEIELMAYKRNPAGGIIQYPVRMSPEPNQADIRIVLDPKLHDGVEDIDKDQTTAPVRPNRPPRQ